jgi:hypothetical protein
VWGIGEGMWRWRCVGDVAVEMCGGCGGGDVWGIGEGMCGGLVRVW